MKKHYTCQIFSTILILALQSSTSAAATTELCTKAKEKYAACTSQAYYSLLSPGGGDTLNEVCQMINHTLLRCAEAYAPCRMNDTLKLAQDEPMGKLVKECQIFNEGNRIECDDETVLKMIEKSQTCIDKVYYNLSMSIVRKKHAHVSVGDIYDMFCNGMKEVTMTCSSIFANCNERKRMIKWREENLKILHSIFIDSFKTSHDNVMEKFHCQHLSDIGYYMRSASASFSSQGKLSFVFAAILLKVISN